jgi:hypothetical protein
LEPPREKPVDTMYAVSRSLRPLATIALAVVVALGLTGCEWNVYPVSQEDNVLSAGVPDDFDYGPVNEASYWIFHNDAAGTSAIYEAAKVFFDKWAPNGVLSDSWVNYRVTDNALAPSEFACNAPKNPTQENFCDDLEIFVDLYDELGSAVEGVPPLFDQLLGGVWFIPVSPAPITIEDLDYISEGGFGPDPEDSDFPVILISSMLSGEPPEPSSGGLETVCGLRVAYVSFKSSEVQDSSQGDLQEIARIYFLSKWFSDANFLIDCDGDEETEKENKEETEVPAAKRSSTGTPTSAASLARTGIDSLSMFGIGALSLFLILLGGALMARRRFFKTKLDSVS